MLKRQSCAERLLGKIKNGECSSRGRWQTVLSYTSVRENQKKRTELKWPSYSPVSPIGFFWGVGERAAWFKYRFLLWLVDGRLRILCQQHKSLAPTMRVLMMFFVAQIGLWSSSTPPCTALDHGPRNSKCTFRDRDSCQSYFYTKLSVNSDSINTQLCIYTEPF